MFNYIKVISNIFKNYKFYSFVVLLYEVYFLLIHGSKYNRFKYLNSNFLSDSIPCPFFFLNKINKFIFNKKINIICDLGSGYGKILYFFANILKKNIHGIELEEKIYKQSLSLRSSKVRIFNEDILKFKIKKNYYDLFILNDPLKNPKDLLKLVLRIKKKYKNVLLIFINLDYNKQNLVFKHLKIQNRFIVSKNKNIFFCKIK
tara:strand:- start:63 stop:671 length:609 start_codon:yes stop_codon:yes gene_type:complete